MPRAPEDPADALWLLPPSEVVAARDALARRLRAEGRREAASEVARMRRPSWDAHAVNLLAREEPGTVDALVRVGEELRAALAAGDGTALRALATRRREAVDTAVRGALRLAPAARAAGDAVRATFDAAVADPGLAAVMRAGRLERGLRYAGLGLDGVAPPPADAARPPSAEARGPRALRAVRPADAAPARGAAARVMQVSRRTVVAARTELHAAEEELTAAQLSRAEAQDRADRLAAELEAAKDELRAAQAEVRATTRERDRARAALQRLESRAGD